MQAPSITAIRTGQIWETSELDTLGIVKVKLDNPVRSGIDEFVNVKMPQVLTLDNGLFIGAKPAVYSKVVFASKQGNENYFLSYYSLDHKRLPEFSSNEVLLYANDLTKILLNKESNSIYLGSNSDRVNINAKQGLIANRFKSTQTFTEASRKFNGIIRREGIGGGIEPTTNENRKLLNDNDSDNYYTISLDPKVTNSYVKDSDRNPAFVEDRELIYEFEYAADVNNDFKEYKIYKENVTPGVTDFVNRRHSKADVLGLTLLSPNYLLETIKGTIVDIFGNILDLNRFPLPVGKDQNTLNSEGSSDKAESYFKIKELERKSIAYHFEINARKDLGSTGTASSNISDILAYDETFSIEDPKYNYGRMRSRFFFDVDKEGQFKLNVPASSEKGNIPLLTRYENFSYLPNENLSQEENDNPDKLIHNKDTLDILHDSFACPKLEKEEFPAFTYKNTPGSISIKDSGNNIAIKDRRFKDAGEAVIKHGTAYHDILNTCFAHQQNDFLDYIKDFSTLGLLDDNIRKNIPLLKDIVKDTITIGENAGGRSGSLNFDGSIEMNIGANTSDRQSLWLDTAGGIVANIGRDLNNRSAVMSMDGDVYIQIGGFGVNGDSRFKTQNNSFLGAVLDIRIFTSGTLAHMIRFDNNGITLMSPSNINIHSGQELNLSASKVIIEGDEVEILSRRVNKGLGDGGPSI